MTLLSVEGRVSKFESRADRMGRRGALRSDPDPEMTSIPRRPKCVCEELASCCLAKAERPSRRE